MQAEENEFDPIQLIPPSTPRTLRKKAVANLKVEIGYGIPSDQMASSQPHSSNGRRAPQGRLIKKRHFIMSCKFVARKETTSSKRLRKMTGNITSITRTCYAEGILAMRNKYSMRRSGRLTAQVRDEVHNHLPEIYQENA